MAISERFLWSESLPLATMISASLINELGKYLTTSYLVSISLFENIFRNTSELKRYDLLSIISMIE